MRTSLLFASAAAVALTLVACSDSTTAPRLSPSAPAKDITCRSGYHIATRDDGSEECVPDGDDATAASAPSSPAPGSAAPVPVPPVTPLVAVPPVPLPPTAQVP